MNKLVLLNRKGDRYNFKFTTQGVCAKEIYLKVNPDKTIEDVTFINGCNGNLKAIGILVKGSTLETVAEQLRDISCGAKPTSCGDQLAIACEMILETTFNEPQEEVSE